MVKDFSFPEFFPERLCEPYKRKKPAKIFVCSMGEIFDGLYDWFHQILKVCRENPQHTFQFLTKKPQFYYTFQHDIPSNCWLGTSIDRSSQQWKVDVLSNCSCKFTRFVLVEPLLSNMNGIDFSKIDLLFVGAQTGPGAIRPMKEWIYSIKHHNIIYKENIKQYL